LEKVNQALWARCDKPYSVETVALKEELQFESSVDFGTIIQVCISDLQASAKVLTVLEMASTRIDAEQIATPFVSRCCPLCNTDLL
jgi:hypothetical protein